MGMVQVDCKGHVTKEDKGVRSTVEVDLILQLYAFAGNRSITVQVKGEDKSVAISQEALDLLISTHDNLGGSHEQQTTKH